jgi:hypothetical protein
MWSGPVVVAKELAETISKCRTPKMRQWSSSSRRNVPIHLRRKHSHEERGRAADDPHGYAPEDLVEGSGELGIPITKVELGRELALQKPPGQVPRLLNNPIASWTSRAAGQVHFPTPDFDEEEFLEPG